ncbi:MAG: hypothetical protein LRY66_15485 [Saccharospirillaceae bacterium]|nr:hypothetical protein [Saccharospirillaceae bacterium]MCD8532708.1 hypothetical protein [Saccharospirillaceae bacterium]
MKRYSVIILASALLAGCFGDDDNKSTPLTEGSYAVQTVAADYTSSSVVTGNILGERSVSQTILVKDKSDFTVNTYGKYLYHIGRYNIDSIARYDSSDSLNVAQWEYSTNDNGADRSNPYKIIHVSDDKAYVIRYGAKTIWQINPQAESAGQLVVDTIDLSAYNYPGADFPRMSEAAVYNDKLFVVMQRLDNNYKPQTAYVAVIDTADNTEIDTDPGTSGLKGIPLSVTNPVAAEADNGYLYIAGRGNFGSDTGGLEQIDMTTLVASNIISDTTFSSLNNTETNTYFHITDVALASDQHGYVTVNIEKGYDTLSSKVYEFNRISKTVGQPLNMTSLNDVIISDIAIDTNQRLWVGVANKEDPGIVVIDTDTNTQSGNRIELQMPPKSINFLSID